MIRVFLAEIVPLQTMTAAGRPGIRRALPSSEIESEANHFSFDIVYR